MTTHVAKWGNSLGVRLSRSVAQEARIDEGDRVDVTVKNGAIVIRPARQTYSPTRLCRESRPGIGTTKPTGVSPPGQKRGDAPLCSRRRGISCGSPSTRRPDTNSAAGAPR